MPLFLTCYDYGMGGVWLYIEADSPEQIHQAYEGLTVFETPPAFWDDEHEAAARENLSTNPFWRDWLNRLRR